MFQTISPCMIRDPIAYEESLKPKPKYRPRYPGKAPIIDIKRMLRDSIKDPTYLAEALKLINRGKANSTQDDIDSLSDAYFKSIKTGESSEK